MLNKFLKVIVIIISFVLITLLAASLINIVSTIKSSKSNEMEIAITEEQNSSEKKKTYSNDGNQGYIANPYDIFILDSSSAFSRKELMRSPGIFQLCFFVKETYKKYLDSNPGLEGIVVIKFTVTHYDGSVVNDTILSSTTGNKEFDEEIRNNIHKCKWDKLSKWERFKRKRNTTTITFPFRFWESTKHFLRSTGGYLPDILKKMDSLQFGTGRFIVCTGDSTVAHFEKLEEMLRDAESKDESLRILKQMGCEPSAENIIREQNGQKD